MSDRKIEHNLKPVVLEDAKLIFRNFSGKEGQYNREGDRNFGVLLDDKLADAMERDGWNIKRLRPREEGDSPQAWIPVAVRLSGPRPPRCVLITSGGRTQLGEDDVNILDWAEIKTVDLIIRPREWELNGRSGIKAYLKSIFVTIEEDPLELKYADMGDSAQNCIGDECELPLFDR